MLVYRVEHTETKSGPYQRSFSYNTDNMEFNQNCNYKDHPMPGSDGIFELKPEHLFGFVSLDQLFKWFHFEDDYWDFNRKGFGISVYEVNEDHILKGCSQCAFDRTYAERIDVLNFIEEYRKRLDKPESNDLDSDFEDVSFFPKSDISDGLRVQIYDDLMEQISY